MKLAWAIIAHKIQGQTISNVEWVQELQHLVIINSVQKENIYPSEQAMAELEIMNLNTLNSNQSSSYFDLKLVSVNIRSLRKHMVYLIKEPL